ncbi:hypothetical protein K8R47_03560, partial [archaeon]|nr:hypothetical protein [archaeon]
FYSGKLTIESDQDTYTEFLIYLNFVEEIEDVIIEENETEVFDSTENYSEPIEPLGPMPGREKSNWWWILIVFFIVIIIFILYFYFKSKKTTTKKFEKYAKDLKK